MHSNIYIVIPVYNERESIKHVVDSLLLHQYSVIVVDDGSTDRSIEIIQTLPVYYLQHAVNLGQGAAIQTGISFALLNQAEYIVTFDADGQHVVADIETLLTPLLNKEADIVFGSRFIAGSFTNISFGRKVALNIARLINYLFTGLLLSDAHNGLRAMNKTAAAIIRIREQGMAHASELLLEVKRNKLRFCEAPVSILYTDYSKKKGQPAINGFKIFFDLLFNKLFK